MVMAQAFQTFQLGPSHFLLQHRMGGASLFPWLSPASLSQRLQQLSSKDLISMREGVPTVTAFKLQDREHLFYMWVTIHKPGNQLWVFDSLLSDVRQLGTP